MSPLLRAVSGVLTFVLLLLLLCGGLALLLNHSIDAPGPLAQSKVVVIPNATHYVFLSREEEVISQISDFVNGLPAKVRQSPK